MTTRGPLARVYRLKAIRAAERTGNVTQTARDPGLNANLIHWWKRELRDDCHRAFSSSR